MLEIIHSVFVITILIFYGIMNFCVFCGSQRLCLRNSTENYTEDNTWKSEER